VSEYFVHESSYVDEGAKVGLERRSGIFPMSCPGRGSARSASWDRTSTSASRAVIGNGVKIQNNISIYDDVIIEDEVFCGPSCVFTNVVNPRAFVERKNEYLQTRVKTGASIGANATVVCGVTLGRYCFVGAGSTVTRDVADYALVFGVPAKQHGWVSREGRVLNNDLIDAENGVQYEWNNGDIVKKGSEA
jgi:UDP-2-acetamido-3-amino-2,3-dideoxy-glucuronate N-acetyltransferase